MREKMLEALREAKKRAKKRNFVESVDVTFNFRNIDFKKPENRIEIEVELPKGRGKEIKVCAIVDKVLPEYLKGLVDRVITRDELMNMDKKTAKKLAKEFDFFVAEPSVMPLVGRVMGRVLGPRKKMPKVLPPSEREAVALVKRLKRTVVLTNKKGKPLPTVHAPVGTVEMPDEDVVENMLAVYNAVVSRVGQQNIESMYVKTTMGPAVRVIP